MLALVTRKERRGDVSLVWRERNRSLDAGHFLAEERPEETVTALLKFRSD